MRKVTQDAAAAFMQHKPFTRGNTTVRVSEYGTSSLYLHDNLIARHDYDDGLEISDGGWHTVTTKERLNGLPGVSVHQKNYEWFLNGEPWHGGWATV